MRWRDFVDIVSLASIWELDADPTQRIDPSGRHHRAATLAPLTRVRPAAYRADFYRDFHVRRCIGVGQASA